MTARKAVVDGPRVPILELHEGEVLLSDQASHYVLNVHRLATGARFVLFDPEAQLEADAELLATVRSGSRRKGGVQARARVGSPRPPSVTAPRRITLVQALVKGAKMDAVVRDATELGATRIVVATCERSVRRRSAHPDSARRWRRIAVEAARQCGRGDAPTLGPVQTYAAAIEACAPEPSKGMGLCMDPTGDAALGAWLRRLLPEMPLTVVVGPEGGLTGHERAQAATLGYHVARLGPFVMRTETVCAAVLGAVLAFGS